MPPQKGVGTHGTLITESHRDKFFNKVFYVFIRLTMASTVVSCLNFYKNLKTRQLLKWKNIRTQYQVIRGTNINCPRGMSWLKTL